MTSEWQDISTAPKDGQNILVFDKAIRVASWMVDWPYSPFSNTYTGWVQSGGFHVRPTHWMPLPDPPIMSVPV